MQLSQRHKGAIMMMLSALSFSCMQIAVKLSAGIPLFEQVFFRNSFILMVSFIAIRRKGGSLFGPMKYQKWLFGRSFFGFIGLAAQFYAAAHASQGDVTILQKLSPMIVTLLAVLFLKEKLEKVQIPALLLAFVGAIFVIQPSFDDSNTLPLMMALFCAVTSSIAYTLLSYFRDKVDGMTVIMHFSTFCAVASIPLMIGNFVVPNLKQLFFLLLIGVFGSLGQYFITYAYRMAPASEISIYNYSGILFSILLGFLVLGEPIKSTSLIGGLLVVAASLLVYFHKHQNEK